MLRPSDPVPVDRAFDPALCAYCPGQTSRTCRACTRPMCRDHAPSRGREFCYACETEWRRGDDRRTLVVAIVALAVIAATFFAMSQIRPTYLFGMSFPLAATAIAAYAVERLFRWRFRPTGPLPTAAARR